MFRLLPHERELLKSLYTQHRIPTDQYKRRPEDLGRLTEQWNTLTGRDDEPGEILHYMIAQRKQKKWPRLGKNHEKLASVPADVLSVKEWTLLRQAYSELDTGSDNYAFDAQLRAELEKRFARNAKRIVPSIILCAAIEAKRKRGLWVKIGGEDEPFADMDAVAS